MNAGKRTGTTHTAPTEFYMRPQLLLVPFITVPRLLFVQRLLN